MRSFDSNFIVHIGIIAATVATVTGVIASAIAIGIITGRAINGTLFVTTKPVLVQSSATVALTRLIKAAEKQKFFNVNDTFFDLLEKVIDETKKSFGGTYKGIIPKSFSGSPQILNSSAVRALDGSATAQEAAVFLQADLYFTQNYTAKEIGAAFTDLSAIITLVDLSDGPSPAKAKFSPKLSAFSDTIPAPSEVSITAVVTLPPTITTTPSTIASITPFFPG